MIFQNNYLTHNQPKNHQTENSNELIERLSEFSSTTGVTESEDSPLRETAVNYTINSPLRKTLRPNIHRDSDDSEISATFTITPPSKLDVSAVSLEKTLDLEQYDGENSVTATINVPLITNKNATFDANDKLKKSEQSGPTLQSPSQKAGSQEQSLLDIDNAYNESQIHQTIFVEKLPSWRLKCENNSKVNLITFGQQFLFLSLANNWIGNECNVT